MYGVKLIGNVHTYAKNLEMQTKWRQKQQAAKSTEQWNVHPETKAEEESLVEKMAASVDAQEEAQSGDRMQEIRHKLMLGSTLSPKDLEYLKEKSPEMYEEYVQAEEERKREEKAYKEALRRCRTQEEVERLKSSAINRSLARAEAIEKNPNIPPERKAIKIAAERRKAEDVDRNTKEFVRRGEYRKLPTEAEVVRAEKAKEERAEARREADDPEKKRPIEPETEEEKKVRRAKARAAYSYLSASKEEAPDNRWSQRA